MEIPLSSCFLLVSIVIANDYGKRSPYIKEECESFGESWDFNECSDVKIEKGESSGRSEQIREGNGRDGGKNVKKCYSRCSSFPTGTGERNNEGKGMAKYLENSGENEESTALSSPLKMERDVECATTMNEEDDVSESIEEGNFVKNYCSKCNVAFRYDSHYEQHFQNKHPNGVPYYCGRCGVKFSHKRSVMQHVKKKHGDDEADSVVPADAKAAPKRRRIGKKRPIVCDVCKITIHGYANMENHAKLHPGAKLIPCHGCGEKFKKSQTMWRHIRKRHSKNPGFQWTDLLSNDRRKEFCVLNSKSSVEYGNVENIFRCVLDGCGKRFKIKQSLRHHIRSKHGQDKLRHMCVHCSKVFYSYGSVKRHESTCGRRFEKQEWLRSEGYPRYHCDTCDRDLYYAKLASFQKHVLRHKQYERCVICNDGFHKHSNPYGLAKHMREKHSGVTAIP